MLLPTSMSSGSTALMFAAHAGHEELCKCLLEAGAAGAAAQNVHGLTAEDMAARRGFRGLAGIIAAYAMAKDEPEVTKEAAKAAKAAVKQLPPPVEKRTNQAAKTLSYTPFALLIIRSISHAEIKCYWFI